jgi:hypothetical protein
MLSINKGICFLVIKRGGRNSGEAWFIFINIFFFRLHSLGQEDYFTLFSHQPISRYTFSHV